MSTPTVADPAYILRDTGVSNSVPKEFIELPIQKTVSTHAHCCICEKVKYLDVFPEEAILQKCIKGDIYIYICISFMEIDILKHT